MGIWASRKRRNPFELSRPNEIVVPGKGPRGLGTTGHHSLCWLTKLGTPHADQMITHAFEISEVREWAAKENDGGEELPRVI